MTLPQIRDTRFITVRRGGTLTDANHHLLATDDQRLRNDICFSAFDV